MKSTLLKDVTTKAGETFNKGAVMEISFIKERPSLIACKDERGKVVKIPLVVAYKYFSCFKKSPTERTLWKYSLDGIARSVTGKKVEPDGFGPDGSPSWLLVMGLI